MSDGVAFPNWRHFRFNEADVGSLRPNPCRASARVALNSFTARTSNGSTKASRLNWELTAVRGASSSKSVQIEFAAASQFPVGKLLQLSQFSPSSLGLTSPVMEEPQYKIADGIICWHRCCSQLRSGSCIEKTIARPGHWLDLAVGSGRAVRAY